MAYPIEFNKFLKSANKTYLSILSELTFLFGSQYPVVTIAEKINKAVSIFEDSHLKEFFIETGNQDIRSAIKIFENDLYGQNIDLEVVQVLTLLKKGRDTFLTLIEKENKSIWTKLDSSTTREQVQSYYTKAFMATTFITFCYKLLKDQQKTKQAFSECKLYFYYRLYYMAYTEPLEWCLKRNPSFRDNMTFMIRHPYGPIEQVYRRIQLEEENFIEFSNDIANISLPKTLGNNYTTFTYLASGSPGKFGPSARYGQGLHLSWKPPI